MSAESAAAIDQAGSALTINPLSAVLGAEIVGVNLARADRRSQVATIKAALLQHHLLVLRDQKLDEAQLQSLAEEFGEIEGKYVHRRPGGTITSPIHLVQNLDAQGKPSKRPYNFIHSFYWHTDKSYTPVPSLVTMLQAIELPPKGGDTEFANMEAAYAALPEATKQKIQGLRVEHNIVVQLEDGDPLKKEDRELTDVEKQEAPPVIHPLVRTHPETGRRSLYMGMYCRRIVGMPDDEGRALLKSLSDHATRTEFTYTQKWRPGDLVMWDNRCLLHRAVRNYEMDNYRRILRRAVVRGSVPC